MSSAVKKTKHRSPWDALAHSPIHTDCVATVILGGGRGTRLFPLTAHRCKPATPFGGRYLLIDVPISNSLNSHMDKIFVVTQFLSSSLQKHIHRTYRFDSLADGFVEILAPEEKPTGRNWYQGTADAVRQNIDILREVPVDYFLILSGDQLYRMDYSDMLYFATQKDADLVVATLPVDRSDAQRMGIMQIDEEAAITRFVEKPSEPALLDTLVTPESTFDGLEIVGEKDCHFLANMGVYLFKRQALIDLLQDDPREDFGKHLIPSQVEKGDVYAFLHNDYWEDIGTIKSFHEANLALTKDNPRFNPYDQTFPLHSYMPCLPGPKFSNTKLRNSIVCQGCVIHAKEISDSIIGPRTHIRSGTVIQESYIMGNDYFTPPGHPSWDLPDSFEIGENCTIRKTIMDRNVRIGSGVQLINKEQRYDFDADPVFIRDGIIVVTKGADLPDGYIL